jgi:pyridoxal phosphate enzyme (YggS family)
MSYGAVMAKVAEAASAAGRSPVSVRVVAVSKGRSLEEIMQLYGQGVRDFGENRAQELAQKAPLAPNDIRWHFIGPLQSNKVRIVRPVASMLHSLDRVDLATAWMKGQGNPPPALLEVNIAMEPQKHGVAPGEVMPTLERMSGLGVPVRGLMTIPPVVGRPEEARPFFALLRELRDLAVARWPLVSELSMGMSDDFEAAIAERATLIRIGRAIFED